MYNVIYNVIEQKIDILRKIFGIYLNNKRFYQLYNLSLFTSQSSEIKYNIIRQKFIEYYTSIYSISRNFFESKTF